MPNAKVSTLMCLNCSIEANTMIIHQFTELDGTVRHRKLLKRRQMLLGLRGAVPVYSGGERFNQNCKSCGIEFVTKAAFKDRVYYCDDCQRMRAMLTAQPESGGD
jgi:formamidopyrimidine-DNA glycosylase